MLIAAPELSFAVTNAGGLGLLLLSSCADSCTDANNMDAKIPIENKCFIIFFLRFLIFSKVEINQLKSYKISPFVIYGSDYIQQKGFCC